MGKIGKMGKMGKTDRQNAPGSTRAGMIKAMLSLSGCLLGSIVLGTVLMILVYMLPVERMRGHLQASLPLLQAEFDNSNVIYDYPTTLTGLFTDCIMLESAVYENPEHGLLDSAMQVYRGEKQEEYWTPGESLAEYIENGELPVEVAYGRYWHGYLVLLKPLLCFLDVGEMRLLGTMLLGVLGLAVLWGFYRRNKMEYGMAFGGAMLWMLPLSLSISLSLSVCLYIMLFGVLAVLYGHGNGNIYLFLFLGIATAYFDLLTYPLVTLGIPLCVWLIVQDMQDKLQKTQKQTFWHMLGLAVSWGFGYGGMWAGKWAAGDLLTDSNIIGDALATLTVRTGNVEEASRLESFFAAAGANLGGFRSWAYLLLALVFGGAVLAYAIGKRKEAGCFKRNSWLLCCYVFPVLMPIGWILVTANHSAEHWMFTCRIFGITVFGILCMLLQAFGKE